MDHACTVRITYCTQCNWLLRASWMATELLSTFGADLGAVTLVPGTGGIFLVEVDDRPVWDRSRDGGFPDIVTLKQRVRDVAVPNRDLGHGDTPRRPVPSAEHSSATTEDTT